MACSQKIEEGFLVVGSLSGESVAFHNGFALYIDCFRFVGAQLPKQVGLCHRRCTVATYIRVAAPPGTNVEILMINCSQSSNRD